jgi:hypothetical protein
MRAEDDLRSKALPHSQNIIPPKTAANATNPLTRPASPPIFIPEPTPPLLDPLDPDPDPDPDEPAGAEEAAAPATELVPRLGATVTEAVEAPAPVEMATEMATLEIVGEGRLEARVPAE